MHNPLLIMLKVLISRNITKNKILILNEAEQMTGFMRLLMKPRNTHHLWTTDEMKTLRAHLLHLSWYIPVFIIFCLPGGSLLLPVIAELLDRRRNIR